MKNQLGEKGEEIARQYLSDNNFAILEQNWHYRHKEIDIIARKEDTLYIVEVKARSSNYLLEPRVAVNRQKQADLIVAANAYVQYKHLDLDVQFDIIEVILSRAKYFVRYIPNAFYPIARKR